MTFVARASQRAVSCRQLYRVLLMSLLHWQVKRLANNKRRRDNTLIREENSIDRDRETRRRKEAPIT